METNVGEMVQRAKELAYRAHAGQVDKAGRPYIEHVRRVADTVAATGDEEATATAWLHDVAEDAPGFGRELLDFPIAVQFAVIFLTRTRSETADSYYETIRGSDIALRVKLADIADNADESRLALLDEKTAARLRRKYAKAREALMGGRPVGDESSPATPSSMEGERSE